MFTTPTPTSPLAVKVTDHLEDIGNKYITQQAGKWYYYNVEVEKHPPGAPTPILRMTKTPPVLRSGFVVTQNRMYSVTVGDLLRGIIRSSNLYVTESKDATENNIEVRVSAAGDKLYVVPRKSRDSTSPNRAESNASSADDPLGEELFPGNILEPGAIEASESEVAKTINAIVDEQVRPIYDYED